MDKNRCRWGHILCLVILFTFLASHIPLESTPFLLETIAEQREYEVEKFNENLTIQPANIRYISYNLDEGEEIEIIYSVQVKENLPIDIWLITEDNYLLFVNNTQFLYYIDGSEQETVYTKKIVALEEFGIYVLVMANYNNQSVEANVICELRSYIAETGEPSSWDTSDFFYPLFFIVIILAVLLIVFFSKARNYKRAVTKDSHKASSKKKAKKRKEKKVKDKVSNTESTEKTKKHKIKKVRPIGIDEELPKGLEVLEPKQTKPEISDKVSSGFCGYCGKPVETAFCIYCGNKV